jgi:hypothetical protein
MAHNFKKAQILEAIKGSAGVMEYVAVKLGCEWHTAKTYVEKWDDTKAAFDLASCKLHVVAYQSFHKAIKDGERWAVERVLDTSARRNGHGSVQYAHLDHTSAGEKITAIVREVVDVKADKPPKKKK